MSLMSVGTIPSKFLHAVDTWPSPRAQMFRASSGWQKISSTEMLRRIAGLSAAFVELGVKPGDRVGLFSSNRPEWHTADLAIYGAGGVTVPVYFNESPDRMTYILNHAEAKVVFVAGVGPLEKLLALRNELKHLEHIVVADGGDKTPPECLRYETLIACAGGAEVASYRLRASQVLSNQLASIIYTSGTTGEPKGVMLTHSNFCSNASDVGVDFNLRSKEDIAISFLPLAHVYGRTLDYIYLFQGVPIAYVEFVEQVAQALKEIRPTVMAAVPRVFEKIYAKLMEQGSRETGLKRTIFDWAIRTAELTAAWRCGDAEASSSSETELESRRQTGLLENPRRNRRPSAHCFFRRRAAFKSARRIFLGRRHSHLSGLRPHGNFSHRLQQLSDESRWQFRPTDSALRSPHRSRRRNPGARPDDHAGLLQTPGSHARSPR